MRHVKFLTFSIFFVISFLFFSQPIIAISENDINFSWISTILYDQDNPNDFEIDDSLIRTRYNNTDYYEHVNPFESENYTTNDYLNNTDIDLENSFIIYYQDIYYIFLSSDVQQNISLYNENFEYISSINMDLSENLNNTIEIRSGTTDHNFIYLFCQTIIGFDYYYFVVVVNQNLIYLKILFSQVNDYYDTWQDIEYYNQSLYFSVNKYIFPDYFNYILQYSLNGIFMYEYDANDATPANIHVIRGIAIYQDLFYISTEYDANYHVVVLNKYFIKINEVIVSYACYKMFVNKELLFLSMNANLYIYNLELENNDYYNIIDQYPNSDGLFDSVNNVNVSLQEQTNPVGYYQSIYNFDTLDDFSITESGDCQTSIISYFDKHKDVLKLNDSDSSNQIIVNNNFESQTNGTIEYWIAPTNATQLIYLHLRDANNGASGHTGIDILMQQDFLRYYDGSIHNIIGINDNTWYHIRIDFECFSGGYEGLSAHSFYIYLDGVKYGAFDFWYDINEISNFNLITHQSGIPIYYFDALGYSWDFNYEIGDNYEYSLENNSFHNELNFMTEDFQEIISISCRNGTYYINNTTTDYNVFFNNSQYVYDTWKINISINQQLENGTFYVYNESNSLLFSQDFNTNCSGNIKYVKYIQYYQDSNHFIYISNFSIKSNNTRIAGKNGFISYQLNLIDTSVWNFETSSLLTLDYYGKYRFYVANDTYGSENVNSYMISEWIGLRNEEITFDLSYLENTIINPYLIVETMNGMYLLNSIKINGSGTNWILYDDRGYTYDGIFSSNNVNTNDSYFYINNGLLYYDITYDDSNEEYIKLVFDIENINNLNYQFIETTYCNESDNTLLNQIKLKNNDGSYNNIDIPAYYDSSINTLEQDKTTIQLEILISDNDLQLNKSIFGYVKGFTFSYSSQISISIFIEQILIMLIPIIIILSMTFALAHVLRNKNSHEIVNKKAFFPIFLIVSIIVFMLGFFDTWILFSIIISAILYIIKKRSEY